MNDQQSKQFCLRLVSADSEDEIIQLLEQAEYWQDPSVWRFYGDYENNYNTIGNQQSRPDAALVEKLVNSVDARLTNACLMSGIDPESADAPQDIRSAVAKFFEGASSTKPFQSGRIKDWPDSKRTDVARGITLSATGVKPGSGNPSFSIVDLGEGQTPDQMPETLLSLNRSNKLRIPFVQGKFNMGGTGVLKFCGKHNLQLILSRRNPAIVSKGKKGRADDIKWGFTLVRREDPQGSRRSSVYTYLAPLGASSTPNRGGVLRFEARELTILPESNNAYAKNAEWGTLIKLYEYSATGFKSHILMKDGLLGRVDLLLPDIALPMRFHECRDYRGHEGSFETTLTGVRVRLEDDKGKNLEEGFPVGAPMNVAGEEMLVSIYAFRKKGGEAYRKNEGIIFVVNGQTHGHLTQDFFARKRVGLSYLADSILVIIDCSKLSGRAREDLFMNSRDRLSGGELRQQIEESLEELLKHHQGLRDLKERRRREEIESRLDDAKPLEDILEDLLKHSPTLSDLFLKGLRASTPFKTKEAQGQEQEFRGARFPSYFKFKGKEYKHELHRDGHINQRSRVTFETDAENEYFLRSVDQGTFRLTILRDDAECVVDTFALNLENGIATLSLRLPPDVLVSASLRYVARIDDCSRVEPFRNDFVITVKEAQETGGRGSERRKPPSNKDGEDREKPTGIKLPNIVLVNESEWENYSPAFDKYTAMRIRDAGATDEESTDSKSGSVYDFFVNMDNLYLKSELKATTTESELIRAQFKYGMVLMGLAMLQRDLQDNKGRSDDEENRVSEDDGESSIEVFVERVSRAVAPVLIPMIDSLGALSLADSPNPNASGDSS